MLTEKQTKKLQDIQSRISSINENIVKAREQKRNILTEITQTVSEQEKTEILESAEKDFLPAKEKFENAKQNYDIALRKYNSVLELLNYRIKNSFGKTKNRISVSGNIATIEREGKKISVDISDKHWQKEATKKIEQDLGITNGTARNIVYKVSLMMK